jgi:hypothetical protein
VTAPSLTVSIGRTLAPSAEVFVCSLHAVTQNGVLDEAEVGRNGGVVDVVDDCDGIFFMRGESSDLTPVAVVLFLLQSLEESKSAI